MTRRRWALTGAVALVALAGSILLGSSIISSPSTAARDEPAPTATPVAPHATPTPVPDDLAVYEDTEVGFSIAYPRTWTRLEPADSQVRLLVAEGTKVSLLIRVTPVGLTVTRDTLEIARSLTDRLVTADQRVQLLSDPEAITLDGLPGYRYVYTFGAAEGGPIQGAHVHYFVFRRKRLVSLVFQVPSARALERSSALLDGVAGTFRAVG